MAMANLIVAAFYLFLVDLASIDLIYRILIFLFFAITSIIISVYYVNKLKNKSIDKPNNELNGSTEERLWLNPIWIFFYT